MGREVSVKGAERRQRYLLEGRDGRLLLMAVAAVVGRPALGLFAVAVTSAVTLIARVYLIRRAIRTSR